MRCETVRSLLLAGFGTLIALPEQPPRALYLPMRRNLAEPGDAGVAEGGAGVEAAGDGAGDERPPLLRQQPQHALLRRHQPIQPRRLPVEVVGDGALLLSSGGTATGIA